MVGTSSPEYRVFHRQFVARITSKFSALFSSEFFGIKSGS
jgi:hypothetical protein